MLLLDAATGTWSTAAHVEVNATHTSGYSAAWPTTSGTLAEQRGLCSPGAVGLLDAEGRPTTDLTWPGAPADPQIAGVTGDTAYALYGSCSTSTTRLVAQDVSSHATRTLVTAPWVRRGGRRRSLTGDAGHHHTERADAPLLALGAGSGASCRPGRMPRNRCRTVGSDVTLS